MWSMASWGTTGLALAVVVCAVTASGCALIDGLTGDDIPGSEAGGDAGVSAGDGGDDLDAAACTPGLFDPFDGASLDESEWSASGATSAVSVSGGSLRLELDGDADGDTDTLVYSEDFHDVGVSAAELELTVTVTGNAEALISWDQDQGPIWYGLRARSGEVVAYDTDTALCDVDCPPISTGSQTWRLVPRGGEVSLEVVDDGSTTEIGTGPVRDGNFRLELLADVDGSGDHVLLAVSSVQFQSCE
jgi:hypothetical protein